MRLRSLSVLAAICFSMGLGAGTSSLAHAQYSCSTCSVNWYSCKASCNNTGGGASCLAACDATFSACSRSCTN